MNEGIPGWKGPERPVDVVLVMHVLYYIPDRMAAVRQFYSWLRPGGTLLIFQSYKDNIFLKIGKCTRLILACFKMFVSLQQN